MTSLDFSGLNNLSVERLFSQEEPAPTAPKNAGFCMIPEGAMKEAAARKERIMNELAAGAHEYLILKMALEIVSLLTNDSKFYEEAHRKILEVHGEELGRELPLRWFIEQQEEDVAKIERVLSRTNLKQETRTSSELSLEQAKRRIEKARRTLEEREIDALL